MKKSLFIWSAIFGLSTFGAMTAAKQGFGLAKPMKEPMSIREGSIKGTNGHYRTRYFIGGGIHGGK